ncbi:protein tweety-like isoform X2 [Oppia nitens]|uniref:protein tweety-like isoform X2 n=1 Tax=Oppia nitens TaxID=1686743 RepID=UPI0023DAE659|nr:protein tweety-like isoform X2 [Oppia nitens]
METDLMKYGEKVEEYYRHVIQSTTRDEALSPLMNTTLLYDNYNISIFAKLLHSLPHIDIRLNYLQNKTFNPNDNQYLESLGILVAIPGFWLIITLLFFLIFFLCRCCDANNKKKRKLTACKCCLFMFAIISAFIIFIGIFGSLITHHGIEQTYNKTDDMTQVVRSVIDRSIAAKNLLNNNFDKLYDELKAVVDRVSSDLTVKGHIHTLVINGKRNVSQIERNFDKIYVRVENLNISSIPDHLKQLETVRWPTTFATLGVLTFICLILIWGVCRHSRCLLILFSVLGLLSLVVCWVITSIYLGISVAGSDFCLDPQPFISQQLNNAIEEKVFDYYILCKDNNPFRHFLQEISECIEMMVLANDNMISYCSKKCTQREITDKLYQFKRDVDKLKDHYNSVRELTDCSRIHSDYNAMMTSTCKDILEGVVLMLLSSSAAGLCFTILVLCASHTWINIRKKRPLIVDQTEETDPFLPPASSTSTTSSSANSKRIRDSYGSGGSARPRFDIFTPFSDR